MKRALFVAAGLGDSLLTLPLARRLRANSRKLAAVLTSTVMSGSFLEKLGIFDRVIELPRGSANAPKDFAFYRCAALNFKRFDEVYLPCFSLSRYHRQLAGYIGRRTLACDPEKEQSFPDDHDALRHLRLAFPHPPLPALSTDLIAFSSATVQRLVHGALPDSLRHLQPFVVVQVSGIQDPFPQKSWAIQRWMEWLQLAAAQFPSLNWVLIGGPREQVAIDDIMAQQYPRVHQTPKDLSLESVAAILHAAKMFVGLDGGLMHLAVCVNTPTFTLWGASNPSLYGYEKMDSARHRVVSINLPCGPCESWVKPNQTRVTVPRDCPDFRCMRDMSARSVFAEFQRFLTEVVQ